jgi:thiamine-phosphate pyrophosphorylase
MAMEVAERDADYIGFALDAAETSELITWWAEMMNTPCVAFGAASPDDARAIAAGGADFIALSPDLWNSANPAAYLGVIQEAIGPG